MVQHVKKDGDCSMKFQLYWCSVVCNRAFNNRRVLITSTLNQSIKSEAEIAIVCRHELNSFAHLREQQAHGLKINKIKQLAYFREVEFGDMSIVKQWSTRLWLLIDGMTAKKNTCLYSSHCAEC